MKNYMKNLLALLLCAALLCVSVSCGAFAEFADGLEIESAEPQMPEIEVLDSGIDVDPLPADDVWLSDDLELTFNDLDLPLEGVESEADSETVPVANAADDFYIITYDSGSVDAVSYDGPGGFVQIPSGVTIIGHDIFKDRVDITGVGIPNTVIEIGWYSFEGSGITSINIPASVTSIGQGAFSNTALKEVTIPESVKDFGMHAFSGCKSLKRATIREGAKIGRYMFDGCDNLEFVSIPGSAGIIENQEFMAYPSLKSVVLGEGITRLEGNLFQDCSALASITLPSTLEVIEYGVFENCASLKEINLPKALKRIGESAFRGCKSLKTVQFQDNLKTMGESVFSDCESLEKVILPPSLTVLKSYSFSNCSSLKEVSIPGSIKVVEDTAFESCLSLEKVKIGDGVLALSYSCFINCPKLLSITIPESVVYIGTWALGCLIVDGWWGPHLEGFKICGKAGSVAEEYADSNKFEFDDGSVKPKSITITKGKSAEIEVYKTLQLKAKLSPAGARTTLTWASSNEEVATVSEKGLVKGVDRGKATITVTTKNGKTAKITIKVVGRKPSKVTITNGKEVTIKAGKKLQLKTKLSPYSAETKLTWRSSNTKVVAVSSKGLVTAKKAGTAIITVKTANGKKATIKITVR